MTRDELLQKAQTVRQNLDELAQIPQSRLDEFRADARNLHATLHLLQTSIQALIDIGSRLCAKLGRRRLVRVMTCSSSWNAMGASRPDRRIESHRWSGSATGSCTSTTASIRRVCTKC